MREQMPIHKEGIYYVNPHVKLNCKVHKSSKYFNEYMISYRDPYLGGESYEWADARKIEIFK